MAQFRISTWNLARSRPRFGKALRLREWMARVAADVWVLTETHRELAPGPEYSLVASSVDAPDRDAERSECWTAIWSRLPAEPVEVFADRERMAAAWLVESGVVVIGAVLPWLTDDRHPEVRGEAAFRARLAEQAADWLRLIRLAPGGLCVAGDFNQDLLSSGHYYGSAGGRAALRMALAECGLDCLTAGTDDPLAGSPGLACIDHIAVAGLRAAGKPRSTACPAPGELQSTLSDHYGVWSDLAVPKL